MAQRSGRILGLHDHGEDGFHLDPLAAQFRNGPRLCENVFPPPKTARNRERSASTRRSEQIFALSSPESTRAQARATLSDLNDHTMRVPARAVHARIAIRSGLMPTMFITRVRL